MSPSQSPGTARVASDACPWTFTANETRWYAVQCQPHQERRAALHLTNQNFEVFLPYSTRTRRHARRIETVRAPFFPGYLFVTLNLSRDLWRSVNGTVGVIRLIAQGDRPSAIPVGVIETLISSCGEDGLQHREPDLVPGQLVRVLVGPFADLVGQLDTMTGAGRVKVLFDILGGQIPVFLPRETLVPVASCL